jgi:hypothetical protein
VGLAGFGLLLVGFTIIFIGMNSIGYAEQRTGVPFPVIYPGGYSETEILFPYYGTIFASKLGVLAGNHLLTVTDGNENLRPLGEKCLWEGAQDIVCSNTPS